MKNSLVRQFGILLVAEILFAWLPVPVMGGEIIGPEGPVCIGPGCGGESAVEAVSVPEGLSDRFERFDRRETGVPEDLTGAAVREPSSTAPHVRPSRWNARLETGIETNDNVPAISDELSEAGVRRNDHARFGGLTVGFRTKEDGSRSIEAQVYQNRYDHLHEYDVDRFRLGYTWRRDSNARRWTVTPWITRYELGNSPYLDRSGIDLELLSRQHPDSPHAFRLTTRQSNFRSSLAWEPENRDGFETRVGIFQYFLRHQGESRRLVGGIGLEGGRIDTRGQDYDARTLAMSWFCSWDASRDTSLLAGVEHSQRDHSHPNSRDVSGRHRNDRDWTSTFRLDHSLHKYQRVFVLWSDRQKTSNFASRFSYRSRGISIGYIFDF